MTQNDEPKISQLLTLGSITQRTETGVRQTTYGPGEITARFFNAQAAQIDKSIRAKLIELGWAPPDAKKPEPTDGQFSAADMSAARAAGWRDGAKATAEALAKLSRRWLATGGSFESAADDLDRVMAAADGDAVAAELRTLAAQQDDASADGTPNAHPAYWRGEARGVEGACMRISAVLDGEDSGAGAFGSATLDALRRRLLASRAQGAPEGWIIARLDSNDIAVESRANAGGDLVGYVASRDSDNIASATLYALADAILSATEEQP